MLSKHSRWTVLLVVTFLALVFWGVTQPIEVHAARSDSFTVDNSCLSCHEDLYQLHDTGCWYCMTEPHKDRCVDCHEGNPSAFKEKEAHVALLVHPQENDGAKCLECHTPEESQALMVKFEANQGFDTVIRPEPYTPSPFVKTGFPATAEVNPIIENLGWLAFGTLMFGVWLMLVVRSNR